MYLKLLIHFLVVRCDVLTAVKIQIAVPCVMTLHSLVGVYQHLGYFAASILSLALKLVHYIPLKCWYLPPDFMVS